MSRGLPPIFKVYHVLNHCDGNCSEGTGALTSHVPNWTSESALCASHTIATCIQDLWVKVRLFRNSPKVDKLKRNFRSWCCFQLVGGSVSWSPRKLFVPNSGTDYKISQVQESTSLIISFLFSLRWSTVGLQSREPTAAFHMRTTSWKAQLVHNAVFLTWDLCPIALLNRLRLQCALKKLEVMEKKLSNSLQPSYELMSLQDHESHDQVAQTSSLAGRPVLPPLHIQWFGNWLVPAIPNSNGLKPHGFPIQMAITGVYPIPYIPQ